MKSFYPFLLSIVFLASCGVQQNIKEKDLVGTYQIGLSMIKVIDLESKLELNRDNSFNLKETMDGSTLLKSGSWSIDEDTLRMINTKDTKNKEWANQSYLIQADSLGKISVGAYEKIKN